ncbi:MAG: tetratricopeptide repeat protein [Desulfuromonadales bacterium]|nr:tetratricopeptide repeat protein [Desulfuromonadales bacterium]NIR33701.1 tetratricopeptide repeat protein [Desulfuromonadales bacterium]NIS44023.1 tetratricopeptide repeat protein [Desulfuromonadales bacterium]
MRTSILVLVVSAVLMAGCSMPKLVVLNDPLDARQHNDLGVSYEKRGEYDLAEREYKRAAKLDDEWAKPVINLGNAYAAQEEWQKAQKAYRKALEREPGNTLAMNNLAWALIQTDDDAEAISWGEKAVADDPDNPYFWDTLAEAYAGAGRPDKAREAVEHGLSLAPPPALESALKEKLQALND